MVTVERVGAEPVFLTVNQIAEKYGLSEGTVRMWLLYREHNGLARCVCKIGRLIRIHEPRFVQWMEMHLEAD